MRRDISIASVNVGDQAAKYWLDRLSVQHNAQLPQLEVLDSYYEGEQSLSYMHPEQLRRLGNRVRQVVVNWPELVVDSLDERLDVTGVPARRRAGSRP